MGTNRLQNSGQSFKSCGKEGVLMQLGWTLLLAVVGLVLLLWGSCWYFSFCMNRMLYSQINDLEYIRSTGLPPDRWQRRYLQRAQKRGSIDREEEKRQTKKNLRKLKGVIRFAPTTKFMESEGTRADVLEVLNQVKRDWEDGLSDDAEQQYID